MQTRLLINGHLVNGEGPAQPVLNPALGSVLVEINEASEAQVDAAVRAADNAFAEWSQTTPKDRSLLLLKLADAIEAHGEELAKLESDNCGKPYSAALNDEIPAIADVFRFFAGASRCMSGSAGGEYLPGHTSMIRRDPVGVIASIAPWNYPLMMVAWKIAPALAAGNTVVLKPSEQTPLTALRLAELASDIFPAGVLNLVFGRGPTVGSPLVTHPKVRMVSLTGSIATGSNIISSTADSVKRLHMELGGKAPVIIFDDADIDAAVEGIRTFGFYNAGQDCTAACRIYAQQGIYEKFVEKLGAAVSSIKYGLQEDPSTELGPLITAQHRDRVAGFVERAVAQPHIRLITGGKAVDGEGCFFEPTILSGITRDNPAFFEEFFGPVAQIYIVKDDEEVVKLANDSHYGLGGSVFTSNIERGKTLASQIETGMVYINSASDTAPELPFGGVKRSGYGRELSDLGIKEFVNQKLVVVSKG